MTKLTQFFLAFLVIGLGLGGCGTDREVMIRREISEELKLDLLKTPILIYVDTHGGFHGDGKTYAVFQLDGEPERQNVAFKETRAWKRFPFSLSVKAAAYGRGEQSSLLKSEMDGIPIPPVIKEGWYYFADRHSRSLDITDEEEFLNRSSYNFVMAFYDAETQRIYYYRVDT